MYIQSVEYIKELGHTSAQNNKLLVNSDMFWLRNLLDQTRSIRTCVHQKCNCYFMHMHIVYILNGDLPMETLSRHLAENTISTIIYTSPSQNVNTTETLCSLK